MGETTDGLGSGPAPFGPPEASGDVGRARSRRLASGIATSLVSRGVAAIAPLLLIPITLAYLGDEIYGLWMATAAVASMALWADFGLGNGLMTKLAPCHARRDWETARGYVSTAYAVLGATAVILLGVLWALSWAVPWASIFNVTDPGLEPLAREITLVCLSAMLVNIPLSLVQRVQYACQEVAQSNVWQAAGGLTSVAMALTAVQTQAAPVVVVAAAVGGPLLVNVLNSGYVYLHADPQLAPRLGFVDRRLGRALVELAGRFFVLSIVTTTALNVDNLIIARTLGLATVTEFSVPARLFTALGLMANLVNLPLWPANGEALAQGDLEWVRRMTNRMTLISGSAILLSSVVLVACGDIIISAWVGNGTASTSPLLLAGLAVWWFSLATASPRFMVQNAAGVVRPQLVGWVLFLILSLPLKWIAAREIGVVGVPFAGALIYLGCVWPAAHVGYRRTLSNRSRVIAQGLE